MPLLKRNPLKIAANNYFFMENSFNIQEYYSKYIQCIIQMSIQKDMN